MKAKPDLPKGVASSLYNRIREILETARANVSRTVNTTHVIANWMIGHAIIENEQRGKRRAGYGREHLKDLSARLQKEYGTGYSVDNLELFRRLYLEYPELISDAVSRKLTPRAISDAVRRKSSTSPSPAPGADLTGGASTWRPGMLHSNLGWLHYRLLLRVADTTKRAFYEIEAITNAWSGRELERQINSLLYERLARSRDKRGLHRLATRGQEVERPVDALKDPVVMEFLDLPVSSRLVESKLEYALIANLQSFLMELGKGFAFVSRQERITLGGDHFYVDLVFYHTILKCFVVIDLKVGKLTHGDLGQMQFYVNYFDRERRTEGDNPTIGLILCPDKNDTVVRYTLGEQLERNIFASRYQLHLPTEAELQVEIRREMRFLSPTKQARKTQRTDGKRQRNP